MNGFSPIYNEFSRCLILGSFPSVKSRKENFYYGNKQNRFWKIMAEYFNVKLDLVSQKIEFLLKNNIALWDIVASCNIEGSLDTNIRDIVFCDIKHLLNNAQNIIKIFCNGKLSFELTNRYCSENNIDIPVIYLPSTSPANAKFNKQIWFDEFDLMF